MSQNTNNRNGENPQLSRERNERINEYVKEDLLRSSILRVLKLDDESDEILIKRLPYSQSYDFIDKQFKENGGTIRKDVIVYYSFSSNNAQKHVSQIIQSKVLQDEYKQYNKLFNYDEYVRVDDLLKVDIKQNIPILFTIFIANQCPELKDYQLKLVNNLKFNEN